MAIITMIAAGLTLILGVMSALCVVTFTVTTRRNRRNAILSFIAAVVLLSLSAKLFQFLIF